MYLKGRPSMTKSILLVEDDVDFAESVTASLRGAGYHVDSVGRVADARERLLRQTYDLVLSDINLPDSEDLDVIESLSVGERPPPLILLTGEGTFDRAVQAILRGAFDYLRKPVTRSRLLEVVEKAVAARALAGDIVTLPCDSDAGEGLVGQGPAMTELFKEIGRAARQPAPILILGETGTGKELVARAVHRYGGRRDGPFVPVNCGAIPETLVESELFGHEKGAFSGAQARRFGRFQEADGGTLFLDEVGDLPLSVQVKLLRVLQEREVRPLGGTPVRVDVRVVAATHRDLEAEVRQGRFREDLYFRLHVAPLRLPSLRERREDIPALIACFLRRQAADGPPLEIAAEALRLFQEAPWPGNVRQLENAVRRASMLTAGRVIGPDPVCRALGEGGEGTASDTLIEEWIGRRVAGKTSAEPALLRQLEAKAIAAVLHRTGGRRLEAARLLGINRKTLREKIALYGLEVPGNDPGEG